MAAHHKFGYRSLHELATVVPDLQATLNTAIIITPIDFTIIEGKRSRERQRELFDQERTRTLNSRHLTGHAVDIAPWIDGQIPWQDREAFDILAAVMFRSAWVHGILIQWGGHFGRMVNDQFIPWYDGPHFQIPWSVDPGPEPRTV